MIKSSINKIINESYNNNNNINWNSVDTIEFRCYYDDTLYLSLLGKDGHQDATCEYYHPNYQRVLADIERFYNEVIIPQGD